MNFEKIDQFRNLAQVYCRHSLIIGTLICKNLKRLETPALRLFYQSKKVQREKNNMRRKKEDC